MIGLSLASGIINLCFIIVSTIQLISQYIGVIDRDQCNITFTEITTNIVFIIH